MIERSRMLAVLVALTAAVAGGDCRAGMLTLEGRVTDQLMRITTMIPGNTNASYDVFGSGFRATFDGSPAGTLFCVDLQHSIRALGTYEATARADAIVHGSPVANAGSVAYLVTTFAPLATTADAQGALQAAIWRAEYGSAFQLDGADNALGGNTPGVIALYNSMLASLGNLTAPVESLAWYSPRNGDGSLAQGLVGFRAAPAAVPEPSSLALCGIAGLAGLGAWRARRKS